MSLARLGDDSVARFGEYTALHFEGRELTNVDQQRTAARVAGALTRMGVGPDRVVVLLSNCPEVLAAYTGILKAGAVIVPIAGRSAPHPGRLRGQGRHHGARARSEDRRLAGPGDRGR